MCCYDSIQEVGSYCCCHGAVCVCNVVEIPIIDTLTVCVCMYVCMFGVSVISSISAIQVHPTQPCAPCTLVYVRNSLMCTLKGCTVVILHVGIGI